MAQTAWLLLAGCLLRVKACLAHGQRLLLYAAESRLQRLCQISTTQCSSPALLAVFLTSLGLLAAEPSTALACSTRRPTAFSPPPLPPSLFGHILSDFSTVGCRPFKACHNLPTQRSAPALLNTTNRFSFVGCRGCRDPGGCQGPFSACSRQGHLETGWSRHEGCGLEQHCAASGQQCEGGGLGSPAGSAGAPQREGLLYSRWHEQLQ